MKVLIPVRYPLTPVNERAIRRGLDLVAGHDDPELMIFHLNEIQTDRRIGREKLRNAVESVFDGIEASYIVRDGFLVEEAVLEEAIRLEVDLIVLSGERQRRWRRILESVLDIDANPECFIRDKTGIEVEVVAENGGS
jgi:nucleotide-binding universal stress UspA family protein